MLIAKHTGFDVNLLEEFSGNGWKCCPAYRIRRLARHQLQTTKEHNPPRDPLTSFLLSTATFLLGLLVGNWLAIGQDKRKEFNEIIKPIQSKLRIEKERPGPIQSLLDQTTLDQLETHFVLKRESFLNAVERYRKARNDPDNQYQDSYGQVLYISTEELNSAIDALLKNFLTFR